MPEIIDQANELEELQREAAIAKCRINHAAVSATHCRDCGEEIPSDAGNWWLVVSAALIAKKKRNYAVSIGGRDVQVNSERPGLC